MCAAAAVGPASLYSTVNIHVSVPTLQYRAGFYRKPGRTGTAFFALSGLPWNFKFTKPSFILKLIICTVVFREIETVFGLVRIPVLFVPNTRS